MISTSARRMLLRVKSHVCRSRFAMAVSALVRRPRSLASELTMMSVLERRRTTFHCIRCDALYTASAGTELYKCPKCGHENSRLRF